MNSPISTYFFIGSISDISAEYQIQNMLIDSNYVIEIYRNGLAVWGKSNKSFEEVRAEVVLMLDIIFGMFVLFTNKPLTYNLENWVETKENIATKNIIGWFMNQYPRIAVRPVRSPVNSAWKKSIKFCKKVFRENTNYSLALKDYQKAVIDRSDEAFFYAFRSIESICRAVTGLNETNEDAWDRMHNNLGTTKEQIDPLLKVAKEIRHGKRNTTIINSAKLKRNELINMAKKEIEIAFNKYIFK